MASRAFPPALILLALTVMALPTWRTTWLGPTADSVEFLPLPWFAPILVGYGNPFPLLCLGATVLALALSLARAVGGGRGSATQVTLGVAAAAAVLGGVFFDGLHGWAIAAPALLLLCLLVMLCPRLLARAQGPEGVGTAP